MSRVWGIIKNDMYFQRRTGIYLLYLMLTILYLAVLHAIPADLKKVVAELLIFTDPAAMGLRSFCWREVSIWSAQFLFLRSESGNMWRERQFPLASLQQWQP